MEVFSLLCYQSGQLDLKHFDPEFVREPVPGVLFFSDVITQ